jgi:mono/diheme cytochrome c family protein
MRRRIHVRLILPLVLQASLAVAGQDGKREAARKSDYAELDKVPAKNREKENPLAKDSQAVAAGGILFEQHCQECHGANGVGSKKGPSLREAKVQDASDGAIFWLLTNGVIRRGMPSWSKLPEPQRWQIIRFIKSLGTDAGEKKP